MRFFALLALLKCNLATRSEKQHPEFSDTFEKCFYDHKRKRIIRKEEKNEQASFGL